MNLKFKATIWKTGNSHVVTIPFDFINGGNIPIETELEFSVEIPDEKVAE